MISSIYRNFRVRSVDKNAVYLGKLGTFSFEANYTEILCIYDSAWNCLEPASLCSSGPLVSHYPSHPPSALWREYKVWKITWCLIPSGSYVLHEWSLSLSELRLHCNACGLSVTFSIVTCRLKAGISKSERASIARQRLGRHVFATIRSVKASFLRWQL
jgi:hypothetical protein